MILRSLATALSKQNWSIVAVELIVVIAGIFLGLRVDDWNEARKLRAEDRLYIERLHTDVQAMIESNQADLDDRRVTSSLIAVQALQDCELAEQDRRAFNHAVIEHQVISRLVLERATYDEMVASGALARLRDLELKQAITRLFAQAETEQQYIEYFATELSQAGSIIWNRVEFGLVPATEETCPPDWCSEPWVQSVIYDFEALCRDGEFRNAMLEVWDSAVDRRQVSVRMDQSLRDLEQRLAQWLGVAPLDISEPGL